MCAGWRRYGGARVVERLDADHWSVPNDFLARADAYEATQGRRAQVRLLSAFDLDRQVTSDGATWLDRELIGKAAEAAPDGFGGEVRRALERRREVLVRQGHASRAHDGSWRAKPDLLRTLERQEVAKVGAALAREKNMPFRVPEAGEMVKGRLADSAQLASGKFAVIEGSYDFSLVPWRSTLESYRGQQIVGTLEPGGGVAWQLGRSRGLGI